ncbi:MAG: hypothetical protein WBF53_03195 [Litorimonas sp.]
MTYQIFTLVWRKTKIKARYDPLYAGGVIAHLELQTIEPRGERLPVTHTGYRSHFDPVGTIERDFEGDVVAAVINWLDNAAQSQAWQEYEEDTRQGVLF